jgi:hypothetical protein
MRSFTLRAIASVAARSGVCADVTAAIAMTSTHALTASHG